MAQNMVNGWRTARDGRPANAAAVVGASRKSARQWAPKVVAWRARGPRLQACKSLELAFTATDQSAEVKPCNQRMSRGLDISTTFLGKPPRF